MKRLGFAFILIVLLGVATGHAQEIYVKAGISGMLPLRRSFVSVELGKRIVPEYSIGMACGVSMTESNVSPVLTYTRKSLSLVAGMGWAHRWQKEGCNDHNFHTYTVGMSWKKPIRKRCSLYIGCSAVWRSYQAHIGLHRGALKMCAGLEFDFVKKKIKRNEQEK